MSVPIVVEPLLRLADQAEKKALEWIKKSDRVPLYLCGDSGSCKSSLLNAFVLPMLREQGWTVARPGTRTP